MWVAAFNGLAADSKLCFLTSINTGYVELVSVRWAQVAVESNVVFSVLSLSRRTPRNS